MGIRNQRRYGEIPEEEDLDEIEEDQELDNKKDTRQVKNTRMEHKKGQPKRSIFDFFITLIGKLVYFIFVFIPKSIFGLFKGNRSDEDQEPRHLLRKFFALCLKGGAVLAFLLLIYTLWISRDLGALDPNHLRDRNIHQSTKLFDRTGQHILYEIFTDERRTLVTLDKIPKYLQQGVIATEDKTFYTNSGVRLLSIGRAVAVGVFTNKQIGGTSTLTQQLIKNAVLTNERSIDRKLKEIILSLRLTQKYSKDEILQIYFNEIPYGSTNYGVESAAQNYFGKTVSELTLEQCATLAGLPKAPSKYLNNPEALKNRRDFVLQRMFEEKYITEQEMKDAQATPLSFSRRIGNITAPHFVFFVRDQLSEMYGDPMVDTGGLSVITSLDYDAQIIAEKAMTDNEKLMNDAGASNAALVSFDAKTSHILAYVGSKDFMNKEINGQFDVVSQARRQPGSSIKPIIYAAAFEKGYTPDTILFDVLTNFAISGKPYQPQNYTLKEYGPVTLRQSLQGSLNIPAVKTFYLVGEKKGIEFANRLGYTTFNDGNFGLSLVLGGGEVSMLEHVHAYSVFADNGIYNDTISILKVQDPKGEVLYEWKPTEGKQVVDPKVTATLSNVLSDDASRAYIFGAGSALTLGGRPVAAKTGTTNGYKDAWTVGYTPSYVTGVWAGNSDNTPLKAGFGGGKVSGQIWNSYMKNFLQNKPVENFPEPPVNDAEKPVLRGSSGGGITLGINSITGKIAVTSTPAEFIVQKTFLQPHDILHYVNKDDPRGPAPENPASDSQYSVWEAAIQDWIARKHKEDPTWVMSFEEPPTEFDSAQSPEFVPILTVLSPTPGAVFKTRNLTTQIEVSAPRGVAKVSYFVDKKPVQVVTAFPFNLNISLREIENGPHELSMIAQDDLGNYTQVAVPITIDAGEVGPYVTWVRGIPSLSFTDFPATFFLNPSKVEQIRELRVFKQNPNGVRESLAVYTDFTHMTNGQIIVPWTDPASTGSWKLLTEITDLNGVVSEGDTFEITVN
jgi:1A family penicillin-binding protein